MTTQGAELGTKSPPRRGLPATAIVATLLAAAVVVLVFRLPGAVVVSALLPVAALLCVGVYRPRRDSAPLWVFLGCAIVCGGIGLVFAPGTPPAVNYATLAVIFTLFALALLATGTEMAAGRAVMGAFYWAFGATMLIGWAEVITGFKLQSILYPDAGNLLYPGRFYVAAYFPNINDFGVVVAMFSIMAVARFLFDVRGPVRQVVRLAAASASAVLIFGGGSRGSLVAMLVGWALLLLVSLRQTRRRALPAAPIIVAGFLAMAVALYVWSLPVIQDSSTKVRGDILRNTISLSMEYPASVWFGWGHNAAFQTAVKAAYANQLMDPHNVLLEIYSWYGLPTLLAFLALLAVIVYRGVWLMELRDHWTAVVAVVLFSLTPVLGIVPSSSLRYYYLFVLAACAIAALSPRQGRNSP